MFGKNPITKPMAADALLNVHSIFYTIQGEGPWAGRPTIFVRFAGCNLRCFWCDTDFEKGTLYTPASLIDELRELSNQHKCALFVLTGGEPLIQPLGSLFNSPLLPARWRFQAETAGTVWPEGIEQAVDDETLMLVCSPKTAKVHAKIEARCRFWKYIVDDRCLAISDGLPAVSTQVPDRELRIYRPPAQRHRATSKDVIYVQAMDVQDAEKNRANLEAAAWIAMKHGYRLSVQVHKLVGLP
jgi:organic radical activating enzyme